MALTTGPLRVPAGLQFDRGLLGFMQAVVDRIEKPRVAARADVNQTISNPPTQAEVQALSDAFDDLLAKLRTAKILDE